MTPEQFVIAVTKILTPADGIRVNHEIQGLRNYYLTLTSTDIATNTVKDTASIHINDDVITLIHNGETATLLINLSKAANAFEWFVILYLAQHNKKVDLYHRFTYIDKQTGERRENLWDLFIEFSFYVMKGFELSTFHKLSFLSCLDQAYFKQFKKPSMIKRILRKLRIAK